jgi:hypothetical protein
MTWRSQIWLPPTARVDGLFPNDVDLGALLLDDDNDMAKVLIKAASFLLDDMAWIWAPPMARGGTMSFHLFFVFQPTSETRPGTIPMLISDFIVVEDYDRAYVSDFVVI